jgi:hypothetical protein
MNHAYSRFAVAALTALAALLIGAGAAAADNVDKLIKDLGTSSDYKVRLSAAASLAKLGDERAIPAFVKALGKDKEKTVRGAAAVGLGKVVTSDTSEDLMEDAKAALETASKKDKDSFVKKQAKKALAKLAKLSPDGGEAVAKGGIYVDIGAMSAKTEAAGEMKALMRKTVDKTFARNAPDMLTKWPGKKAPTKKDLATVQPFHVDGTLNELTTKAKGSATIVSCKVNMLIATYNDMKKSMFGFLNGGASVQASDDERDIELAKQDCVTAVVEDLVIKKIIPTIEAKAGSR